MVRIATRYLIGIFLGVASLIGSFIGDVGSSYGAEGAPPTASALLRIRSCFRAHLLPKTQPPMLRSTVRNLSVIARHRRKFVWRLNGQAEERNWRFSKVLSAGHYVLELSAKRGFDSVPLKTCKTRESSFEFDIPGGDGTLDTTPTPTQTVEPSQTPDVTATPTPSATPTSSPSVTPSITPTSNATQTATPTVTETRTRTPTRTSTPSATPTPTRTPIQTPTPTMPPGECNSATIYADYRLAHACTDGRYSIERHDCSGSAGVAYPHPQQAAEVTEPGMTVLIREGTYNQPQPPTPYRNVLWIRRRGSNECPITYKSFPTERVTLDNQDVDGHVVYIDGRSRSTPDGQPGVNYIRLVGLEIQRGSSGVYARQTGHDVFAYNKIHDNKGPGILIIEQGGDHTDGEFGPDYGHHIINGNDVASNYQGIVNRGHDTLIRGNYAHDNVNPSCGDCPGTSDGFVTVGDYNVTEYNVSCHNSDDGFDLSVGTPFEGVWRGPRFNVVRGNVACNNGCVGPYCGDGSGIKIGTHEVANVICESFVIEGNITFGNRLRGFDLAQYYRPRERRDVGPLLLFNNTVFDNAFDGVFSESSNELYLNNISFNPNNTDHHDIRKRVEGEVYSDYNLLGDGHVYDAAGHPYLNWDTHTSEGDPLFSAPNSLDIVTDVYRSDFADVPGLHLSAQSLGIDAGIALPAHLQNLASEISRNNPYHYEYPAKWVEALQFALTVIQNDPLHKGTAPDIGAYEHDGSSGN